MITRSWEALDQPCSRRVLSTTHWRARNAASRRMTTSGPCSCTATCISGTRWESGDSFKLVDPDGLLADAEYDLGIIMREDPVELMQGDPHERARWLAASNGSRRDRDLGMGCGRTGVDRVCCVRRSTCSRSAARCSRPPRSAFPGGSEPPGNASFSVPVRYQVATNDAEAADDALLPIAFVA